MINSKKRIMYNQEVRIGSCKGIPGNCLFGHHSIQETFFFFGTTMERLSKIAKREYDLFSIKID